MKGRDKLYKQFVKNDRILNSVHHANYKKARNEVNRMIKKAKDEYFQKQFGNCNGDTRKMWRVLNNAMKRKSKKSKLPNFVTVPSTNGKLSKTNCKQSIANSMNKHFSTIGKKLANKLKSTNTKFSDYLKNPNSKNFFLYEAEEVEVKNLIFDLVLGKSVGIDENPPVVIKWGEPVLTPVLTKLFNKCVAEGVYPDFLKIAKVIPIFKGGDVNEENSYRTISILTQFNRIFEKLLHKRLYSFISPHLYKKQFGFQPKNSTHHAVLDLKEHVLDNCSKKLISCILFLDLKKAFDTVSHEILLQKLEYYGVRGIALKLVESYLTNRYQQTSVDGYLSILELIEWGVPQGSVLGPLLLFLLTIYPLFQIWLLGCSLTIPS